MFTKENRMQFHVIKQIFITKGEELLKCENPSDLQKKAIVSLGIIVNELTILDSYLEESLKLPTEE